LRRLPCWRKAHIGSWLLVVSISSSPIPSSGNPWMLGVSSRFCGIPSFWLVASFYLKLNRKPGVKEKSAVRDSGSARRDESNETIFVDFGDHGIDPIAEKQKCFFFQAGSNWISEIKKKVYVDTLGWNKQLIYKKITLTDFIIAAWSLLSKIEIWQISRSLHIAYFQRIEIWSFKQPLNRAQIQKLKFEKFYIQCIKYILKKWNFC